MEKGRKLKFIISILFLSFILIGIIFVSSEVTRTKEFLNEKTSMTFYNNENKKILAIKSKDLSWKIINNIVALKPLPNKEDMAQTILNNMYGNSNQPFINRLKREISSIYLEHFISKKNLTVYYMNELYFQNGIIGIGNAAQYYFNKDVGELNLVQLLYLLTINEKSNGKGSTDIASSLKMKLQILEKHKIINERQSGQASKQVPLLFSQLLKSNNAYIDSYLGAVTKEAADDLKINEQQIMHKNLKIYTTMDMNTQKVMFNEFNRKVNFPQDIDKKYLFDGSMVVMKHSTGEIVGLIGGRNPYRYLDNYATDLKREPGSTFKPLVVYGPAIEQGWKPADLLMDKPLRLGTFKPLNYDYKYRGQVSLKDALTMSYNVPTVWLLTQIGLTTGVKYMNQYGLFQYDVRDQYQIGLGYLSNGVSPLQMVQAYTVFSNGGQMVSGFTVKEVENQGGNLIFKHKLVKKNIFEKSTADKVQSLLRNVIENGTGKAAAIDHKIVYGKTGTTSYDGWFVGSTDDFTSAIWIGTKEKYPNFNLSVEGGAYPAQLYKTVISKIAK